MGEGWRIVVYVVIGMARVCVVFSYSRRGFCPRMGWVSCIRTEMVAQDGVPIFFFFHTAWGALSGSKGVVRFCGVLDRDIETVWRVVCGILM